MFSDFNQNYQIQNKNRSASFSAGVQKSFIQVKPVGDMSQLHSKSPMASGVGESFQTPLAVAQALNQGTEVSLANIDSSLQQAQATLNQQIILIKVLENARVQALQREMTRISPSPNNSVMMPKGSNIFAPKPMHAKVELGRIGRSRSMYVTNNPLKTDGSSGEKSIISDKPSEEASQASGNKEASDAGTNRKRMNVFKCPHKDRKHYAKNMCNNCYHKLGRNK